MKKLLVSLLALVLIAGCSSKPAETPEPTATPEETPAETPETEAETAYELGVWEDTNFSSKTLNMRLTLPEGWTVESSDYQQAVLDAGAEVMDTDKEDLQETYLEFFLKGPDQASSIQGMSQYVGPAGKTFTLGLLTETLKSQLTSVEDFTYEVKDEGTVTIGGEEYGFLYLEETNYALHQKVYFRVVGEYLFNLTVSTSLEGLEVTDAFISSIQTY
ncbi:hypothetical protein [Anaerorhabdus sp.]|uniref:hypothetical protein n=1 Tax=Anaerorhabdus sp. TaxID=1872524 RepID=UPI002FC7E682